VESASGSSWRCSEQGCSRDATFWVPSFAMSRPSLCERHAAEYRQSRPEPRDPAEDHLAEMDALRARLRAAEDVCYQVEGLLRGSLANIDLQMPPLRNALRRWTATTKGM